MDNKIIEFDKAVEFEGETYNKIDLSKLDDLLAEDLLKIDKMYAKEGNIILTTSEMTLQYAVITASYITKLPIEFFNKLPAREAKKIKQVITNFFFN